MIARSTILMLATAAAATLAVGAWQLLDYRAHRSAHLEQHRQHGHALLDAAEAVAIRECRGGRTHLAGLTEALDETRAAFGLRWLSIQTVDGGTIAASGSRPEDSDPTHRFEKEFAPLQPNPGGRGPRRVGDGGAIDLPTHLVLDLATRPDELDARMAEDRLHAILTTIALGTAFILVAGAAALRLRAIELRTDLARSQTRLEGLEMLGRLGAGLAHETRNPLGVVRGHAERLAIGKIDPAEVRRSAQAIVEETDRTVARLEEFMLLSRPAALRRSETELRGLFEELRMLLQPDLEHAGATLSIHCGDGILDADREQLRRLLMNLLLNAIQAVEPGGHVALHCEPGPGPTRVVVEDDGPGVPDELRATLFEPYVSGRAGGTGLGLSIARRIARDHGFELRHQPREPRGTRMILEIPHR